MEACASGHYWGRKFERMGHQVILIPPQHLQPFVRGGKSDARDALAIVEAAQRPKLHPVPIKSVLQQDLQSIHRIRSQCIGQVTADGNQIRGIAREYGVEFKSGINALIKQLPEVLEDDENELTAVVRQLLFDQLDHLRRLRQRSDALHARMIELAGQDSAYSRLLELPGVGPVVGSAYLASVGNGHQFHKGREVSAWLGLVPRQHGTRDGFAQGLLAFGKPPHRSRLRWRQDQALRHEQERRPLPAHHADPWCSGRDLLVAQ